jgi:hypothetical protein
MKRNIKLERVAGIFIGDWALTIANRWWLDDPPGGRPSGLRADA